MVKQEQPWPVKPHQLGATMPSNVSFSPIRLPSVITRPSQLIASMHPPAGLAPFTAATVASRET